MTESYLNAKIRHSDMASHFPRESVHTNPDVIGCYFYFYLMYACWRNFYLSVISDIITLQIFSTIENRLVLVWCLNRNWGCYPEAYRCENSSLCHFHIVNVFVFSVFFFFLMNSVLHIEKVLFKLSKLDISLENIC